LHQAEQASLRPQGNKGARAPLTVDQQRAWDLKPPQSAKTG
jgi:hypothetical protein